MFTKFREKLRKVLRDRPQIKSSVFSTGLWPPPPRRAPTARKTVFSSTFQDFRGYLSWFQNLKSVIFFVRTWKFNKIETAKDLCWRQSLWESVLAEIINFSHLNVRYWAKNAFYPPPLQKMRNRCKVPWKTRNFWFVDGPLWLPRDIPKLETSILMRLTRMVIRK